VSVTSRPSAAGRLAELMTYRQLLVNLTVRDLKVKYKGSALGILWSLLNPLVMMAIYTLVFSVFLRAVRLPNYWAFVLGGLLSWIFFSSGLTSATASFTRNPSLITKVAFPIESLPLAGILAHFVNFLVMVAVLLVILVVAGLPLGLSLVLLPVVLLAHLAFTIGLGLLLATVTVYFRDLEHLVALVLTAWFYVTPILYPLDPKSLPSGAGRLAPILMVNPLSWFMDSYHAVLFTGRWPDPKLFTLMMTTSAVALVVGYGVFTWLRPRIPEEV
jgi:ABC-2 type transport system permease protein